MSPYKDIKRKHEAERRHYWKKKAERLRKKYKTKEGEAKTLEQAKAQILSEVFSIKKEK